MHLMTSTGGGWRVSELSHTGKGEKDNLNSRALIASASMGRMQSASVAQMTRVGSAQSNMQLPPDFLNTEADEWAEQRKLLKKRQNHQMMELVHKISSEESNQKQLLEECKNDEERIKLRQKFIEKKIANQKVVKAMMATHHKESEYLEARARGDPLDGEKKDGEGEEEQTAGEEEENEGEPEEVMA